MTTRTALVMLTLLSLVAPAAGSMLAREAGSDRFVRLNGLVVGTEGRPWPGCVVSIVPDDVSPELRSKLAVLEQADAGGRFTANGLLEGTYLVAASPDINPRTWLADDSLRRVSRIAGRVILRRGETRNVLLPCTRLP